MDGENYIGNRKVTLNTPAIRHLFDEWPVISNQLQRCPNIFLFLDYDGSLVPIVDTPKEALLPQERKQLLYKLSQCSGIQLWIITGRPIGDIRQLVGIDGIGYAGNHGLEIQCPHQPVKEFYTSVHKEIILKIQGLLNAQFSQCKGILFENKGPILAVHYRLAETGIEQEILTCIESIKGAVPEPFNVAYGKKVIEIRTIPDKTKGTTLTWIKKNVQTCSERSESNTENTCRVYLGDDVTDEDALKVLDTDDIGVFIGKPLRQTAAKHYLLTVDEVWDFLLRIYELFRKK